MVKAAHERDHCKSTNRCSPGAVIQFGLLQLASSILPDGLELSADPRHPGGNPPTNAHFDKGRAHRAFANMVFNSQSRQEPNARVLPLVDYPQRFMQ